MITDHGIHKAHDAAVTANSLRHLVRLLSEDETHEDRVGLSTLANLADVLADGLDRYWWTIRPDVHPA